MDRLIALKIEQRRKEHQWSKNLPQQTIREMAERDVRQGLPRAYRA